MWKSTRRPSGGILSAVAYGLLLIPLPLTSQAANKPSSVEIITYFRTSAPPGEGERVCLVGGAEPIGSINSVRLLPHHDEYHDAWEVVLEINARDAMGITADSIAQANLEKCRVSINVVRHGLPIAYHTVLKGEVTYFAEIAYMIPPKPWWQPAMDFIAMDIGIIWVEIVGASLVLAGLIIMLISRTRRKHEKSPNRPE